MFRILEKHPFHSNQHQEPSAISSADHEMLERVLYRAVPRRLVKRLAKEVIARFGSFADAIAAPPLRLREVDGMTSGAIAEFKLIEAAVQEVTKVAMMRCLPLGKWREVIDYCRATLAFEDREIFRVLFVDKRLSLIADEVLGVGTINHVTVYPREVIRRALDLAASGIILVHNHPSGDPTPSKQDVDMTLDIMAVCNKLGLAVHDHIIVGRYGHVSLKGLELIS